jgi:electron transfer flavoprotein beta subunit
VEILVAVKRVPMVGGRIVLSSDSRTVDTEMLGFTISPHEECAVEEAVRIAEASGGSVTVVTLGPPAAIEQLRDCVAVGAQRALHLETDGGEWGPIATAEAIVEVARDTGSPDGRPAYDLLLFGNEAADTGDYQVGVRVAHMLGLPCVTGIKSLTVSDSELRARREYRGVEESFELPLPAVITVKEGINLPRYPSLPGRMRARKAAVTTVHPTGRPDGLTKESLAVPAVRRRQAEVLGNGPAAVPALVNLLVELGIVP